MIKTIVVHLDSGERCAARVDLAAALARRHGSRLVGVAPTGVPDVVVSMRTGPSSYAGAALVGRAGAARAASVPLIAGRATSILGTPRRTGEECRGAPQRGS